MGAHTFIGSWHGSFAWLRESSVYFLSYTRCRVSTTHPIVWPPSMQHSNKLLRLIFVVRNSCAYLIDSLIAVGKPSAFFVLVSALLIPTVNLIESFSSARIPLAKVNRQMAKGVSNHFDYPESKITLDDRTWNLVSSLLIICLLIIKHFYISNPVASTITLPSSRFNENNTNCITVIIKYTIEENGSLDRECVELGEQEGAKVITPFSWSWTELIWPITFRGFNNSVYISSEIPGAMRSLSRSSNDATYQSAATTEGEQNGRKEAWQYS